VIVPHSYNDRRRTAMPKLRHRGKYDQAEPLVYKRAAQRWRAFQVKGGNPSGLRLFLPIRKSFPLPVVGHGTLKRQHHDAACIRLRSSICCCTQTRPVAALCAGSTLSPQHVSIRKSRARLKVSQTPSMTCD
jgi:hypothetical protein